MRQLRRFAVEHREKTIDWKEDLFIKKWYIYYGYDTEKLSCSSNQWKKMPFVPYFDSEETAKLAIDTFHDELIWYFTEYKDSL